MTYSKEEVKKITLKYFKGDELATNAWIDKYCLKDKDENLLEDSPDMMHRRLAINFSLVESKYPNSLNLKEIFDLFKDFKYIVPQGRIMAGLGALNSYRSLSNCLVLPTPKDSYSSIMYTDTMVVNAAKRGCGYGIDLSKLRPEGEYTKNASNTSTGIVPFMERYSNSTREVGQDGRRGACLLGIDIKHPQSLDFVTAKSDKTKITGANISLKIDDKFFKAIKASEYYTLEFNNRPYEDVKAPEYWNKIIKQVVADSEPGIFMWDRIINYDPASVYPNHQITLTNACGEQPMSEYDTCRLLVINLYNIVKEPFTSNAYIDYELLKDLVYKLSRIADDLVDLEIEYIDRIITKIKEDPESDEEKAIELTLWQKIQNKAIRGRRVGMGITALGDMLAALNITYGSEESFEVIDTLFHNKLEYELEAGIELAKERGSFPDFNAKLENEISNNFYTMLKQEYPTQWIEMQKYGRRSINWSTIAPTGTTSLMTQTTSGCEPLFQVSYTRRKKVDSNHPNISFTDKNGDCWEEYVVLHSKFRDWITGTDKFARILEEWKFSITPEELGEEVFKEFAENSPWTGSTAHEINPLARVKIQSILQKYTTSAISSTVNLPKGTTEQELSELYLTAWKLGCKGITAYIDGSRDGILLTNDDNKSEEFFAVDAPKRPKSLECDIYYTTSKGTPYSVIIGLYDNKPYEVFATTDVISKERHIKGNLIKVARGHYKVNGDINRDHLMENMPNEAKMVTRACSALLRHRANVKYVVDTLHKFPGEDMFDFNRVIARILKKYIQDKEEVKGSECPECGSKLIYEAGCVLCPQCGYSAC